MLSFYGLFEKHGWSALHFACSSGCVGAATVLLEHGIDIDRQTNVTNTLETLLSLMVNSSQGWVHCSTFCDGAEYFDCRSTIAARCRCQLGKQCDQHDIFHFLTAFCEHIVILGRRHSTPQGLCQRLSSSGGIVGT